MATLRDITAQQWIAPGYVIVRYINGTMREFPYENMAIAYSTALALRQMLKDVPDHDVKQVTVRPANFSLN